MHQIRPGDIIYSSKHKCLLCCTGRNGGRPHQLVGCVVREGGHIDRDTCKIFEASDVQAVQTPEGFQTVLPGSISATYNFDPDPALDDIFDGDHHERA